MRFVRPAAISGSVAARSSTTLTRAPTASGVVNRATITDGDSWRTVHATIPHSPRTKRTGGTGAPASPCAAA